MWRRADKDFRLLDEDECHFIYPSLSSFVDVTVDKDDPRGRKIVAQTELDVGEIVAIEEPNTMLFCPNSKLVMKLANFKRQFIIPSVHFLCSFRS